MAKKTTKGKGSGRPIPKVEISQSTFAIFSSDFKFCVDTPLLTISNPKSDSTSC